MGAYSKVYLEEIVENQGKLFDYVATRFPETDTEDFILAYMKSKTRKYIDEAQAYICTMDAEDLWLYFKKTDCYKQKKGAVMKGFLPDWIGEFYAYYQWQYNIPSSELVDKLTVDYMKKVYLGLHDLDLSLAVRKVGQI